MKFQRLPVYVAGFLLFVLTCSGAVHAQSFPSYEELRYVYKPGGGVKDIDPNVYVYNQAFAERFKMPAAWVSAELEGVDAIAFRKVQDYARCTSSASDAVCLGGPPRCEMDLYFDHQRHPLPWNPAAPAMGDDQYGSSAHFIAAAGGNANAVAFMNPWPLVDKSSGVPLKWWRTPAASTGEMRLARYEREVHPGVAMVTLSDSCDVGFKPVLSAAPLMRADQPAAVRIGVPFSWWGRQAVVMLRFDSEERRQETFAWIKAERQGMLFPHQIDPNIYVYSARFAERFGMPKEWVSDELKGVDAVALRQVADYATCGFNGNPDSCRHDQVVCEMDMYFDHRENPLPWDFRFPAQWYDHSRSSAYFVPSINDYWMLPRREGDNPLLRKSPFTDSWTGKGMRWQGGYWISQQHRGGLPMGIFGYAREVFPAMSLVQIGGGCGEPADALWLGAGYVSYLNRDQSQKSFALPPTWGVRVKSALSAQRQRDRAFFEREGRKALEALRKLNPPSEPIILK